MQVKLLRIRLVQASLERLAYFHNDWFTTLLLQAQCHINSFAAVDNNDVDAERQRVVATTFSK